MRDKIGRKLVQLGFLALFLYPFLPTVHQQLTYRQAPVVLSWLLTWDPLLLLARLPHPGQGVLVVGAPLLLLALTFVGGRFFCGWVCPLGTVLDVLGPLSPWRRRPARPRSQGALARALSLPGGNSYLKYGLALAVLVASLLSLKLAGLLDPLVLFHRLATMTMVDWLTLRRPGFDLYLAASFLFLGILALELWRPRFWCRHLCPQGALLGWLSRWALLNRRVSTACNHCARCRGACPMNAIPIEPHDTDYRECNLCLECEAACPEKAISFGFGPLAWASWQAEEPEASPLGRLRNQRSLEWVRGLAEDAAPGAPGEGAGPGGWIRRLTARAPRRGGVMSLVPLWLRRAKPAKRTREPAGQRVYPGSYVAAERPRAERILGLKVGRRGLLAGLATGAGSLVLWPVLRLAPQRGLIRPPGALPEEEFLAACILCQECIRVCPPQGLKPAFLGGGLRALGTPYLVPRVGGCQLRVSCQNLCARACPVGAIQVIPRERMKLGLARVDHRTCLAWDQAVRCLVCVEACPVEAAVAHQGRVTVDPLKCTGCGICEQACPVQDSAIRVTSENQVRFRKGEPT